MKGTTTYGLCGILMLFLCYTPVSAQTTVLIPATKDNTLFENPTGAFSNGSGQYLFFGLTGPNAGNTLRRALVYFDVAANVPTGASITNAELSVSVTRSRSGPLPASIHRLTQDWGEGLSDASGPEGAGTASTNNDATWIHTFYPGSTWNTPGGDFVTAASASTNISGTGSTGIWTGLVGDAQDMLDNPTNNFGWIILGDETAIRGAKRIDGIGTIVPQNRKSEDRDIENLQALPGLSVTYTALPVELAVWSVNHENSQLHFEWSTLSESDNAGFEIQHDSGSGFEKVGFVQGQGESESRVDYNFDLAFETPGIHQFRLKQLDYAGSFSYSSVIEVSIDLPDAIYLSQGYPNPFNPAASFSVGLVQGGPLQVDVYDSLGRHIEQLHNDDVHASELVHLRFDAQGQPSGNYFVFARSNNLVQVQKITLQK